MKVNKQIAVNESVVMSKIYLIRGMKVMLDDELAELYGVETRRLNEQVKRNMARFPKDFMFQLTTKELHILMSQNATSRWGGRRKLPYAFTEYGVLMLSNVLNSGTAIKVSIKIMRVYVKLREMLLANKDILLKLEKIENEVAAQGSKTAKNEEDIQMIFSALKRLLNPPNPPREPIGFKVKK
jgi:ORF6N domain-containing protein